MSEDKKALPGQPGNAFGRWKPGQSGNPLGRPKSKPYKEALERQLAALAMSKGIDSDKAHDIVAAAHLAKVMQGDMAAIKEFADRIDGKVPNPVGGTDELPPITAFAWKPAETPILAKPEEDDSSE